MQTKTRTIFCSSSIWRGFHSMLPELTQCDNLYMVLISLLPHITGHISHLLQYTLSWTPCIFFKLNTKAINLLIRVTFKLWHQQNIFQKSRHNIIEISVLNKSTSHKCTRKHEQYFVHHPYGEVCDTQSYLAYHRMNHHL
jgi:hypothetical protein